MDLSNSSSLQVTDCGMLSRMRYTLKEENNKKQKKSRYLKYHLRRLNPFFFIWFQIQEAVVAIVKPLQDPEQAAKKLLQEAYQRGSSDNIACVVVQFLG